MSHHVPNKFFPPVKFQAETPRFVDLKGNDLGGAELRTAQESPSWKDPETVLNLNFMLPLWAVGVARGRLRRELGVHDVEERFAYFGLTVLQQDGETARVVIAGSLREAATVDEEGTTALEAVKLQLGKAAMPERPKRARTTVTAPGDALVNCGNRMKKLVTTNMMSQEDGCRRQEVCAQIAVAMAQQLRNKGDDE